MRKIKIDNEKLLTSLQKKDKISKRLIEISDEGKKLETEANQLVSKLQREDEKVKPITLKELEGIEMGEYEQASRIYLGKEGEEAGNVYIEIADRMEEFKLAYANAKNNSSDSNKDEGISTNNPKVVTKKV